MKELILIFEMAKSMGFDMSELTINESIKVKQEIIRVLEDNVPV